MVDKTKFIIVNVDKDELFVKRSWRLFRENEYKTILISSVKNPIAMFRENARLLLFLEFNKKTKVYNLIVNGSIRKWFFGKNVRRDITKKQLKKSLSILAEELNISEQKVLDANITKMELGATLVLKPIFLLLRQGFISYTKMLKRPYKSTDYFGDKSTSSYSIIIYNKLYETCKKNNAKLFRAIRLKDKIYFCRFEISLNSISDVKFFNRNCKTFNQLFENWNIVVHEILRTANKLKYVDSMSKFKYPNKVTRTTARNRKQYYFIQNKGLAKIIREISNSSLTPDQKKNKKVSYKNFVSKHSLGTYKHLKLLFIEKLKVKLMVLS